MSIPAGWSTFTSLFTHRAYVLYSLGSFASLIGTWAQRVAVAWLAWELTGSELWVGLIAFADLIPGMVVAPFAGALIDRTELLRMCTFIQGLGALQGLALLGLHAAGMLDVHILLALTFLLGIISALDHPARLALLPDLLPTTHLASGVGFNAAAFNLARFIGPLGAGLAIGVGGVRTVFVMNAASFMVFAVTLIIIGRNSTIQARVPSQNGLVRDMAEGLAYVASHRVILAAILMLIVTSLGVRPVLELLAPFADELVAAGIAAQGATGLAMLTSVMALGAIAASIWLTMAGNPRTMARLVTAAHLASAICLLLFLYMPVMWLRLLALGVCGCALVVVGVGTQTILQMEVGAHMRGRVLSLFTMFNRGLPAVGALGVGWLATGTGLDLPLAIGAVIAIVTLPFVRWVIR